MAELTSRPPPASLLRLPYELREQIFHYTFQRQQEPIVVKDREISFRHHSDTARPLVGERPRAYLLTHGDAVQYSLYSTHPLGQVNRQLRHEISHFLRTGPVDIVTSVRDFDYTHLMAFLTSLPSTKLKGFTVQPDVDADLTRAIRIELTLNFNKHWASNLSTWLSTVDSLVPAGEELSTAISLADGCPPLRLVYTPYECWRSLRDGPAREELRKTLVVLWVRLRTEGFMMSGVFRNDPLGAMGMVETKQMDPGWRREKFLRWVWLGF